MKYLIFFLTIAALSSSLLFFFEDDEKSFALDIRPRIQYMRMLLADPATGEIPRNARAKELVFAERFSKDKTASEFAKVHANHDWSFAGPNALGGRTRAIAQDIENEETLIAAGVSSGIFKSTDLGKTWRKTLRNDQLPSITSIVQDQRPGKTQRWYAGTGEFYGNSSDLNGDGIYLSTDSGESWELLPASQSKTPQAWDAAFEFVYSVSLDQSNLEQDELYAATALGGIHRSTDGGKTFRAVLGGLGNQFSVFTDVVVSPSGIVYATMSQIAGGGASSRTKGIWRSVDGVKWVNITPTNFPAESYRIVIEINPKDENQVFFFGFTPNSGKRSTNFRGDVEWNSLWQYRYLSGDGSGAGGSWEDRSRYLPNLGGEFGNLITQSGYDLVVKVHPSDTNVIFIGGTNLYRSSSGFRDSLQTTWIGGYKPGTTRPYFDIYPAQHPDQHALIFLRSQPQKAISANDGGLQITEDCLTGNTVWREINESYITSQFYTIAIDHGDQLRKTIMGGLQDNGTYFSKGLNPLDPWLMTLTYDGAFCAIAKNASRYYMSAQQGRIAAMKLDDDGNILEKGRIDPAGGKDYLFINPFTLDHADENIMYVAGGKILWRNNDLSTMPMNTWDSTSVNWDSLSATRLPDGELISSVSSSTIPAHRVYYGTSKGNLYRLDNSTFSNPTPKDITGSIFPDGNIQSIAIDPRNADNIIIVFSNYNVISLFHSTDGGDSWTAIAGNLEDNPNGSGAGPSCRWAEIVPMKDGFKVYVGTSIGLFSSANLNGNATCWEQEGKDVIGNAVITMMDYRKQDGYMAIATHGAGVFTTMTHPLPDILAAPQLRHPAPDTNSTSALVRYIWDNPVGTVFSRLEVSESPDFSILTFTRSLIPNGIYTGLSSLKTGKRYYWRVFAVNSAGDSRPSETRTLTIGTVNSIKESSEISCYYHDDFVHVPKELEVVLHYVIHDISGKKSLDGMLLSHDYGISVSHLPKGTYILTFPEASKYKSFIFNK
jgi:photosystem II stability/assembly factor-like uncharacterized protein